MYDTLHGFNHQITWQWDLGLPCATLITDVVMLRFLLSQILNLPTEGYVGPKLRIWVFRHHYFLREASRNFCVLCIDCIYVWFCAYTCVEFILSSVWVETQKIFTPLQVSFLENEIFREGVQNQFRKRLFEPKEWNTGEWKQVIIQVIIGRPIVRLFFFFLHVCSSCNTAKSGELKRI